MEKSVKKVQLTLFIQKTLKKRVYGTQGATT